MPKTLPRGRVSAARSRNMAAIRSKNTTPELAVRRFLHAAGFRYRLHVKNLPGRPDIVLPKYRTVVLVHGCFWHHHGCRNSVWPRTRAKFWRAKIGATRNRDRRNQQELRSLGWSVCVIWECEVERPRVLASTVRELVRKLSDISAPITLARSRPTLLTHARRSVRDRLRG